jgi:hypothetical protein
MIKAVMKLTTGSTVILAALLWLLAPQAVARGGRAAPGVDEFTVTVLADDRRPVLEGSSAVDLGGLSLAGAESERHGSTQQTRSFSITRRLRLRVTRKNSAAGIVMVSAFLIRGCHPCRLRLDGIELKSGPVIVLQRAQLNTTTDHRLEIEIPASMPAGAVDAEIGWQVESK